MTKYYLKALVGGVFVEAIHGVIYVSFVPQIEYAAQFKENDIDELQELIEEMSGYTLERQKFFVPDPELTKLSMSHCD